MANAPVIVIDQALANLLTELIEIAKNPVEVKNKSLAVKVENAILPENAATEKSVKAILDRLNGVLAVDGSGRIQPVKMDSIPLAENAATEATIKAILEELKKEVVVRAEAKLPIHGEVSVNNLERFPDTISIDNFPLEQPVRINSMVLAPNAASESTLKAISDKLEDKVEVKGSLSIKDSVLPYNAATEATLADIKSLLEELLNLQKQEDQAPVYVSLDQAKVGVDLHLVKQVSIQANIGEFRILGSNDNESYFEVDIFSTQGIYGVKPYFRYLRISATKNASACIVLLYN